MTGEREEPPRGRVLILAGTREARELCARAAGLDVLASLAGATAVPRPLGVPTRVGGFGGEAGFRAALDGVSAVVDATHPFAARISARTWRVCADLGVPMLRLARPAWPVEPDWHRHDDAHAASAALPRGARVFLATGPGALAPFLDRGLDLFCRRVDAAPPRDGVTWVVGGPGTETEERALLARLDISHLVTKNAGGPRAKLDAAAALGIAVHVVERPAPAGGEETHDIARALAFVRRHAAPADHRD